MGIRPVFPALVFLPKLEKGRKKILFFSLQLFLRMGIEPQIIADLPFMVGEDVDVFA